jgi:hypothetical protein
MPIIETCGSGKFVTKYSIVPVEMLIEETAVMNSADFRYRFAVLLPFPRSNKKVSSYT